MKPQIPPIPPSSLAGDRKPFDVAVKESIEIITGIRGEPIKTLPTTASLADVIRKVNEIIARLQ